MATLKNNMMKHMGLYDQNHTMLMKELYGSPVFAVYYSMTYSFIPVAKPEGVEFNVYSNGRGALPTYIALLYDINTQEINVGYDCINLLATAEDVKAFHENVIYVSEQIVEKENIKIADIKVK